MRISKEKLKNIFIKMYTIRKCEETLAKAAQQGLVFGACKTGLDCAKQTFPVSLLII
jgi:TPP-dependent pyruvate/acetoin dehydrogenase alpha subunit